MSDDEIGCTVYRNDELPKRSDLPACPVETCVSLIGSKWKLLIMRDLLLYGSMRVKALQRSVGGVSQKVLTTNLRSMEDAGLVVRRVYAEVPPRVEYSLTELGQSLRPIMDSMWAWGGVVPGFSEVTPSLKVDITTRKMSRVQIPLGATDKRAGRGMCFAPACSFWGI